jgi:hypothetical protein
MHLFKDNKGREWKVEANFGSYGRVKAATGVKLYDIATENRDSLIQLADALTLGQVLWAMVEPQAEARSVTPDEFYEAFDGEVLNTAYAALIDEMIFFCHPRQRKVLGIAVQKVREAEIKADRVVDANLAEYEKEIDRAIDQWTRGFSGLSLPESSASTHEIGPSVSLSTPLEADGEKSGTTLVQSSPK